MPKLPSQDQQYKTTVDWCTEEEYLDGEWVKREEEVTMDNIRRIFQYTVSCPPRYPYQVVRRVTLN